jgi:ribosome biogenesis GTPase
MNEMQTVTGQVVSVFGDRLSIRVADRDPIIAYQSRKAGAAVVGDRAGISVAEGGEDGVTWKVDSIEARTRCLWRSSRRKENQLIVANVDRLCIVSAVEPAPREGLIDRYLVAAECEEIPGCVILNKIDLPGAAGSRERLVHFTRIGYPVFGVSAVTGEGLEELARYLETGLTVLAGHSGVGKSTLLNRLVPGLELPTDELSEATGKGKHTTSVTTAHPFRDGVLVDTPGIREFGLARVEPDQLADGFREFGDYLRDCRFTDCAHRDEPGCAVRGAVDRGALDSRRYASYLRIRASLEAGER